MLQALRGGGRLLEPAEVGQGGFDLSQDLLLAGRARRGQATVALCREGRVLYFYLFRHDFSNSHRPEALWISHFDSLLQKVISPCRGGEGPSPVHLESPQGTVCRPS